MKVMGYLLIFAAFLTCGVAVADDAVKDVAEKPKPKDLAKVEALLKQEEWIFRAFGMIRIGAFKGNDAAAEHVANALKDPVWQVRCFALRAAKRLEMEVPEKTFADEDNAKVIRTALRLEYKVDDRKVSSIASKYLSSSSKPDLMLIGCEIAAASKDEKLEQKALSKLRYFIRKMSSKDELANRYGYRVTALTGIVPKFTFTREKGKNGWHEVSRNSRDTKLVDPKLWVKSVLPEEGLTSVNLTDDDYDQGMKYLEALQKRDLDLWLAIDGTGSMGGIIRQAQQQLDKVIRVLNDLSKSMQVAIVIYRDKDDGRPEVLRLTGKTEKVLEFLFEVEARGGGDLPESVLSGLKKITSGGWRSKSQKNVVVIGDAPPHDEEMYKIRSLVEKWNEKKGVKTHTLLSRHGKLEQFEKIAGWGEGSSQSLVSSTGVTSSSDFGKTMMRYYLTIEVASVFDDFYDLYVHICL